MTVNTLSTKDIVAIFHRVATVTNDVADSVTAYQLLDAIKPYGLNFSSPKNLGLLIKSMRQVGWVYNASNNFSDGKLIKVFLGIILH